MVRAAWIPEFPLEPGEGAGGESDRSLTSLPAPDRRRIIRPQQLHQGARQLLSGPAGSLRLEGVPVAIADHQPTLQVFCQLPAAIGPGFNPAAGYGGRRGAGAGGAGLRGCGGVMHWTICLGLIHPGAMSPAFRRSPPRRPEFRRTSLGSQGPRLLHHLGALHSLAAARSSGGSRERRRRQHLSMAQRLLDPLPEALASPQAGSELFWRICRWGGAGLLLARLLAG